MVCRRNMNATEGILEDKIFLIRMKFNGIENLNAHPSESLSHNDYCKSMNQFARNIYF